MAGDLGTSLTGLEQTRFKFLCYVREIFRDNPYFTSVFLRAVRNALRCWGLAYEVDRLLAYSGLKASAYVFMTIHVFALHSVVDNIALCPHITYPQPYSLQHPAGCLGHYSDSVKVIFNRCSLGRLKMRILIEALTPASPNSCLCCVIAFEELGMSQSPSPR
ncbi:hypothetical protein BDW62DRAFT_18178 [Aspergillus aurantiobrunneus]